MDISVNISFKDFQRSSMQTCDSRKARRGKNQSIDSGTVIFREFDGIPEKYIEREITVVLINKLAGQVHWHLDQIPGRSRSRWRSHRSLLLLVLPLWRNATLRHSARPISNIEHRSKVAPSAAMSRNCLYAGCPELLPRRHLTRERASGVRNAFRTRLEGA